MAASPCYICGTPITELRLDFRDMKTMPCATCESVINDLFADEEQDNIYTFIEPELSDFGGDILRDPINYGDV